MKTVEYLHDYQEGVSGEYNIYLASDQSLAGLDSSGRYVELGRHLTCSLCSQDVLAVLAVGEYTILFPADTQVEVYINAGRERIFKSSHRFRGRNPTGYLNSKRNIYQQGYSIYFLDNELSIVRLDLQTKGEYVIHNFPWVHDYTVENGDDITILSDQGLVQHPSSGRKIDLPEVIGNRAIGHWCVMAKLPNSSRYFVSGYNMLKSENCYYVLAMSTTGFSVHSSLSVQTDTSNSR